MTTNREFEFNTLPEMMAYWARKKPKNLAMVFVGEDSSEIHLNYHDLYVNASKFTQFMIDHEVQPGDTVILILPHSLELIYAFLGAICLHAVPSIFPSSSEKMDTAVYRERVRMLIDQAGANAVITFEALDSELRSALPDSDCKFINLEHATRHASMLKEWPPADPPPSQVPAILQFSSGTTGLQKGVLISHEMVLNNLSSMDSALKVQANDVMVSWLPLYHDMGLIGGFILPIARGIPLVLISPFHWVRDPSILFKMIHIHKGTLSWLPNFAYNHSVYSIRDRDLEGIDLSHWRIVVNGSEPVRHASHELFLSRFKTCGLKEDTLATGYGMTENTLGVTISETGKPPVVEYISQQEFHLRRRAIQTHPTASDSMAMVSSGRVLPGVELKIVDDDGEKLPDRLVGEILIRSNSLFHGYYHRPDLTKTVLIEGWFHTGDMGYLADGELFVCGRKKDLIIVGGRNIYPEDVEQLANSVAGIYPGRAAAFGVDDDRLGTEAIVLVCELRKDVKGEEARREIERELRRRMVREMDIALADVHFVQRGWIVKTSNGKIARSENRRRYFEMVGGKQPNSGD